MDISSSDSSSSISSGGSTASRTLRFLQSPVSSVLEYSGLLRNRPDYHHLDSSTSNSISSSDDRSESGNNSSSVSNSGEVSIRIIEDDDRVSVGSNGGDDGNGVLDSNGAEDGNSGENRETTESSSGRYDIQRATRWIEQILPFLLLFLVVFVRQHLQGFVVAIYVTAILFKSNDILKKQTALKGERKSSILLVYSAAFMLHMFLVYWWHRKDGIFYPLLMIPPKAVPPFWHALFIILVNDIMVRQAAMVVKLFLLMYYKNGRGHNFRRQARMLTLVEYTMLLYRAVLPTPVWYRFFLNKDYGSLFSALITGLYLTFKLTSMVEKVHSFFSALKALSRKEINYGSHATQEQVIAAFGGFAYSMDKDGTFRNSFNDSWDRILSKHPVPFYYTVGKNLYNIAASLLFVEQISIPLETQTHFRNISALMDCVGFEKCRLWGKLQVLGLGTALKILFSVDDGKIYQNQHLQLPRNEVIALVNLLNRLSESVKLVHELGPSIEKTMGLSQTIIFWHRVKDAVGRFKFIQ